MTALGQRIKAFRAERALQQRQLAEKAGLTPSTLSQIESGRLTPSLPTLGKLAGALGVSIASLFEPPPAGRLHVTRKADYPVVSFDGQWVYYVLFANLKDRTSQGGAAADIYKIHVKTRKVVRLTHQEFTPNTGAALWARNYRTPQRGTRDRRPPPSSRVLPRTRRRVRCRHPTPTAWRSPSDGHR